MKWKLLALFATLAVILVIVSTVNIVTLFQGSHNVVNISYQGNDINCQDCHSRIQDQLSSSAIHSPKDGFDCEECHRMTKTAEGKTIKYATHNQSGVTIGNESHAAYTPRCLDCHGSDGIYYNDTGVAKPAPPAPAFNKSDYGTDYSAHKPVVEESLNYGLSKGENEACIACHTNYSMEFEFKRPEWFQFDVDSSMGTLSISSIYYGSTNTTIVHKSDTGAKHEFAEANMNGIKCESCHSDIWQAANHSIEVGGNYDSTNASHVCWQWERGMGSKRGDDPMHNVTCVYSEYGIYYYSDVYDNITEYCSLSCHDPEINESSSTWDNVAETFKATTHVAHRVSCYDCHNVSHSSVYYLDKPTRNYTTINLNHDPSDVTQEPLFLHAETCISCKRDDTEGGTYKTWTEPNNTMYDLSDSTPI